MTTDPRCWNDLATENEALKAENRRSGEALVALVDRGVGIVDGELRLDFGSHILALEALTNARKAIALATKEPSQ